MKLQTVKPSTGKPRVEIPFRIAIRSAEPRIRKVAHAMERRQGDSVRQLAQLVNLSGSRLSHLFKGQTGLILGVLLVKQRLERAAHLLRSTEMTVSEISQQVGYRHAPSFVRASREPSTIAQSPIGFGSGCHGRKSGRTSGMGLGTT